MSSARKMEKKKRIKYFFSTLSKTTTTPILDLTGICIYLLEFLGDAEAGVDPLSALCVFGLIVLQEVASGELSCYEPEQRQVCRQKGTKA